MDHSSTRLRAVIFDLDGTLIDSELAWWNAWSRVYERHDVELTTDTWNHMMATDENPARRLWFNYGIHVDRADFLDIEVACKARTRQLGVKRGALRLLTHLEDRGIMRALGTNSTTSWVDETLPDQLAERLPYRQTIDGLHAGKPSGEVFLALCDAMGVTPRECVVVEDSDRGTRAASDADMACAVIPSQTHRDSQFPNAMRFDHLGQLDVHVLEQVRSNYHAHRGMEVAI